jgi:hypothetical protein
MDPASADERLADAGFGFSDLGPTRAWAARGDPLGGGRREGIKDVQSMS